MGPDFVKGGTATPDFESALSCELRMSKTTASASRTGVHVGLALVVIVALGAAIGLAVPSLTGHDFGGNQIAIANDGRPKLIRAEDERRTRSGGSSRPPRRTGQPLRSGQAV